MKGKLEYDGEYICDKKWNGKGYGENGNIIYELINGNGNVKEYNENDELIFEGEYLNGQKWNGKGKVNFQEFDFEGEWLNGEINGKGRETHIDNSKYIFEGNYLNGEKNSKDIEYLSIDIKKNRRTIFRWNNI